MLFASYSMLHPYDLVEAELMQCHATRGFLVCDLPANRYVNVIAATGRPSQLSLTLRGALNIPLERVTGAMKQSARSATRWLLVNRTTMRRVHAASAAR